MNRIIMFLLPIAALLLLGGFFARTWWQSRMTGLNPSPVPVQQGIEIEDEGRTLLRNFGLTEENAAQLRTVEDEEALGVIRWSENRRTVTVVVEAPTVDGSFYQAWLLNEEGNLERLGKLRMAKTGFVLDHTFPDALEDSVTVVVSRETTDDNTLEERILEGQISL